MITGWLIYNEADKQRNEDYIRWMLEEARHLRIDLRLIIKEKLVFGVQSCRLFVRYGTEEVTLPQFCIMRNIDELLSEQLELIGITVFNPSSVARTANHKARTYQRLAAHHIPMPDTVFLQQKDGAHVHLAPTLSYPVVLKEVDGRGGNEVYRMNSPAELILTIESKPGQSFVVQQMVQPGKDVRVFVVGRRIVGAVLRQSGHDFRANHSLGGGSSMYTLTPSNLALVQRIISLFDFGMAGIDFMFDEQDEFVFNEIEDVVGSRTLSIHSDMNIVRMYLEYIAEQIGRRGES